MAELQTAEVAPVQNDTVNDFEVLGLMRTTSRQSRDAASNRRKSEIEQHISTIPEKDHEETHAKKSSITGLGLRDKLKSTLPNIRVGSGGKEERGHQKHDSANPDPESFEVLGLMRSNTRTSEDAAATPTEQRPGLERHISSIPQDDGHEEGDATVYKLLPKLIRHISTIPIGDYDSEGEEAVDDEPETPTKVVKHDSGTAGSEFEVNPLMRITSKESGNTESRSPMKKPGLERHISRIPQNDDDDDENSMLKSTRLVKTISNIPVHDYDSDGEDALVH